MRPKLLAPAAGLAALLALPATASAAIHLTMNFTGVALPGSTGEIVYLGPGMTRSFAGEPVSISLSLTKNQAYFYVDRFSVRWSDDPPSLYIDDWGGEGLPQTEENNTHPVFFSTIDLQPSGGSITIFPTLDYVTRTDYAFSLRLTFISGGSHDPFSTFADAVTGGGRLHAYRPFEYDPSIQFYEATSSVQFQLTSLEQTREVPEPGTWALMLLGFMAVGLTMRRRTQRGAPEVTS